MQHNRIIPCLSLLLLLISGCHPADQPTETPDPSGWMYLGQSLPGSAPSLFRPGIISTGHNERDLAVSPDGTILFYSYALPGYNKTAILTILYDGQSWSEAGVADFSGEYNDLEPAFSPDGSKIFFISRRPLDDLDLTPDWNIWFADRLKTGWSAPLAMGVPVNSEGNEFYPSLAANGNLYFTIENHLESYGGEDIFYCPLREGVYGAPENLGPGINSPGPEFNAFVSPDEQFLLFSSAGRPDDQGRGDLYISFRNETGIWQQAVNLGPAINSEQLDYCPFVTPDGNYLFFTSQRYDTLISDHSKMDLGDLQKIEDRQGNGLGDIYWVEFDLSTWR